MWFSFPSGVTSISVECQEFFAEIKDDSGKAYFRAPDHFAPRILAFSGFRIEENLPAGAPVDLPKADPLRDSAIVELTKTVEAQKIEIQNLRTDLGAAVARVAALANENGQLKTDLAACEIEVKELEDKIEDEGIGQVPAAAKKK